MSRLGAMIVPLLLLCSLLAPTDGFSSVPGALLSASSSTRQQPSILWAASDGYDDEDEEDDVVDDSSLGDWRKFRASLIDGGLPGEEKKTAPKKQAVAEQNQALLAEQNEQLAEEYRTGVWAHTVGQPEVGGLLCRMPLEAELYYSKSGHWKEQLDLALSRNSLDGTGGAIEDLQLDEEVDTDLLTFSKVDNWFQAAEQMVTREMEQIMKSDKIKNGVLNPNDVAAHEKALLLKYLFYKATWQEICLLLSHNPETGCSESVILNRPLATAINKPLAKMILEGEDGSGKGSFSYDFVDQVVQAFGTEAAVYMGGPHRAKEPALLIHGIGGLRGARELEPGTGIYQGGWEEAVEGILKGEYKPLDFRFFLGRQSYDPKEYPERGALVQKIEQGCYQPLACARSLALKQCLGLPKPLWHEVLELCGGELRAISSIELRKRVDLQQ